MPDDENIDKSVWLPPGEPILTPERAAMADMHLERDVDDGHIRFAQHQVRNIMNWLHERDIIDDQHVHDGQTYERWQMIYRMKRDGSKMPQLYSAQTEAQAGCAEYGFTLVLVRLHRPYALGIDYSLLQSTEHTRWLALGRRDALQRSFDALSRLMPTVRDEIKAMLDKRRQNCDTALIEAALIAPKANPHDR